jgi:hypothetical protein
MKRYLLLAAMFLLAAVGHSTTWYVTTGGSDSNPCTLASPCATPTHAFNSVAAPGDTVNVGPGVYSYGSSAAIFSTAGTAGNPITVTCATRGTCRITNTVTGNATVVEMNNNYQIFDGFEVTNTGAGNNLGIYVTGHDVSLTRNTIHDIQTDCSSSGGGGVQIAVSNLTNIVIDSNQVYNISWVSGAPKCASTVVQTDGILAEQTGFTTTTTITNNLIYNTSGGWGIATSTNALIAHNTIFNTVNGGVVVNNAPSGAAVEDNIIVYTGLLASDSNFYGGACAIQNGTASTTTYGHNELSNNHGGNYGTGFGCSGSGLNTGDIAVDPAGGTVFVNWQQNGSGNYHELSSSPTVSAGTNVGVTHDFDGHVRPTAGYDMGAFQYGVVTGIALSPNGGVVIANGSPGITFLPTCTFTIGPPAPCPAPVWDTPTDALLTANGGSVAGGVLTWSNGYQPNDTSLFPFGAQTAIGVIHGCDSSSGTKYCDFAQVLALESPSGTINIYPTPSPGFYQNIQLSSSYYTADLVVGSTAAIGTGFQWAGSGYYNPIQFACTWSSSNNAIATITRYGLVTGVSPGTVTVSCNIALGPGVTIDNTVSNAGQTWTFNVISPTPSNQIWYIRPDGGTPYYSAGQTPSGQCDGKHDASYASTGGTGVNQPCAFDNFRDGWADEVTANSYGLAGSQNMLYGAGDTVIIRQKTGGYNLGLDQLAPAYGGSATVPINCGNPDCFMPTIPSGAPIATATGYSINLGVATISATNTLSAGNVVKLGFASAPFGGANYTVMSAGLSSSQFEVLITAPNVSFTSAAGVVVRPTRILGENYAACSADSSKTQLNLSWATLNGISILDSQFVDVECVYITQAASCGTGGGGFAPNNCKNSNLNYGWSGVRESAFSSNDTLTNIFIDGVGFEGVSGATGAGLVFDHLHIRGAPFTGIDMDDTPYGGISNISVAGGLTMTNSIIEFTGCTEEKPIVHNYPFIQCIGQNGGGQGDGFGTASTTGTWVFDHDIFRFNLQDGLDLLHSGMQNLSVTNSQGYGSIGNQFKLGSNTGNGNFTNNYGLSNCQRSAFTIGDEPSSGVNTTDICRASATGPLLWLWFAYGTYTAYNNTFLGYAPTAVTYECDYGSDNCSGANTAFVNNVINGWATASGYNGGANMGALCALNIFARNNCNGTLTRYPANQGFAARSNNVYNGMGSCPLTTLSTETCNNSPTSSLPGFSYNQSTNTLPYTLAGESLMDPFNFPSNYNGTYLVGTAQGVYPASGSSLISAFGVAVSGLLVDSIGYTYANPPSIGYLQFQSGTPTASQPTASPTPGTYGSTQSVTLSTTTSGGVICYTITGATPTATTAGTCDGSPTQTYTGAITVSTTTTIKAITTAVGFLNSSVGSFTYTIGVAAPTGLTGGIGTTLLGGAGVTLQR